MMRRWQSNALERRPSPIPHPYLAPLTDLCKIVCAQGAAGEVCKLAPAEQTAHVSASHGGGHKECIKVRVASALRYCNVVRCAHPRPLGRRKKCRTPRLHTGESATAHCPTRKSWIAGEENSSPFQARLMTASGKNLCLYGIGNRSCKGRVEPLQPCVKQDSS